MTGWRKSRRNTKIVDITCAQTIQLGMLAVLDERERALDEIRLEAFRRAQLAEQEAAEQRSNDLLARLLTRPDSFDPEI